MALHGGEPKVPQRRCWEERKGALQMIQESGRTSAQEPPPQLHLPACRLAAWLPSRQGRKVQKILFAFRAFDVTAACLPPPPPSRHLQTFLLEHL